MSTFAKTIKQYEKECLKNDIPAETVMAYLLEISQRERYDLFMHIDDEMPEALASEFQCRHGKNIKTGTNGTCIGLLMVLWV